jgi:RimJ/RimL family protein N-acetyltransferase
MTYRLENDANGGPVLVTGRLVLRRPTTQDLPESVAFWSSDRCRMMGGPIAPAETEKSLGKVIDLWDLRGFGLFAVTLKGSDKAVGFVGPWQPVTYPEPEIGWNLWQAELEGKGIAYEGAVAARDWFFAHTAHRTAVSYTHPDNIRSHRLCDRLGAVHDPAALQIDPPERVYRHVAGRAA